MAAGLRFTLGPEATKLALSDDKLSHQEALDNSIAALTKQTGSSEERVTAAENRATQAEQDAKRFRLHSEKMADALDALGNLADAAVYRNKIEVEVAKIFEIHFKAIHKNLLHTSGLIGLNTVEDEERETLIKQMTVNLAELLSGLGERTGTVRERSHDNVETTKKVAKEVNDTRAAVQATNNQEIDLVLGDDGGMER